MDGRRLDLASIALGSTYRRRVASPSAEEPCTRLADLTPPTRHSSLSVSPLGRMSTHARSLRWNQTRARDHCACRDSCGRDGRGRRAGNRHGHRNGGGRSHPATDVGRPSGHPDPGDRGADPGQRSVPAPQRSGRHASVAGDANRVPHRHRSDRRDRRPDHPDRNQPYGGSVCAGRGGRNRHGRRHPSARTRQRDGPRRGRRRSGSRAHQYHAGPPAGT